VSEHQISMIACRYHYNEGTVINECEYQNLIFLKQAIYKTNKISICWSYKVSIFLKLDSISMLQILPFIIKYELRCSIKVKMFMVKQMSVQNKDLSREINL